ncbi:MAG TPA: DegT/DnrJ/EryC1/StrS family aminotransferase [Fimbriimonadaceae bacterium]|nr:DegT/DnrJ/EryC1/StrS family aminotransferase [Fimbriimonadaceae bacterium]
MPTLKSSPSELAIHGGGPPAFAKRLPPFTANVGDGVRFAALAERMFVASEAVGTLVEEFETAIASWLGVRSAIGFSSLPAAVRCVDRTISSNGYRFLPAFGAEPFLAIDRVAMIDCEAETYGLAPGHLAGHLTADVGAVFAVHPLGRPCKVDEIESLCDEWSVPLFLYGHQALGSGYRGAMLGSFGRAEIIDLGRDQLVHALDSAIVATDDDLLAYRLRAARSEPYDGIDQAMGDAAAAMGIANLESADGFVSENRRRFDAYRKCLQSVPGIRLLRHDFESTFQTVTIEVDPGQAGLSRDALFNVLAAENVGTSKPLEGAVPSSAPVASRAAASLLQLPSGPAATGEVIEAVCKLVELAIIRSLESPDPIHLAA